MTVELTAYAVRQEEDWSIVPATVQREWMNETFVKAALRCLPLNIANQAGWFITCPATFKARWVSRSPEAEALSITFPTRKDEQYRHAIKSNFGSGIITFALPWLFRTSEGIGLWARGPANSLRSEVAALEGLVETDWSPYPFTMNWKILKPKVDVWFRKGDPICMITPYPIGLLEQVKPRIRPLAADRDLESNFSQAAQNRIMAHRRMDAKEHGKFELSYTRGYRPDGEKAPEHRTKLKIEEFVEFSC